MRETYKNKTEREVSIYADNKCHIGAAWIAVEPS